MRCCRWTAYCPNFSSRNTGLNAMPDSLSPAAGAPAVPFAFPLDDFSARSGLPLPPIERLAGEQVPEPYRSLLVHDTDMTPTLESFHGARIHLQILNRE